MTHQFPRPIALLLRRSVAVLAALVMTLAACSSTSDIATSTLPTLETAETAATQTETETEGETADAEAPAGQTSDEGADSDDNQNTASDADADAEAAPGADVDEPIDPDLAFAEFQKCMEDNGVTVEMAGSGGATIETLENIPADQVADGVFEPEDFEAAEAECNEILEDAFGSFELSPEQEAEMADAELELQRCLSEAGFDIDMGGGSFMLSEEIDFEAFEDAMSGCGNEISFGSEG